MDSKLLFKWITYQSHPPRIYLIVMAGCKIIFLNSIVLNANTLIEKQIVWLIRWPKSVTHLLLPRCILILRIYHRMLSLPMSLIIWTCQVSEEGSSRKSSIPLSLGYVLCLPGPPLVLLLLMLILSTNFLFLGFYFGLTFSLLCKGRGSLVFSFLRCFVLRGVLSLVNFLSLLLLDMGINGPTLVG